MSPGVLRKVLLQVASADTSYDSDLWVNRGDRCPLTGHCFAVAHVVQYFFGGDIISGTVRGERHGWNRLPDGTEIDLTSSQFGGDGITPLGVGRVIHPRAKTNPRFSRLLARVKSFF